MSHYRVLLAKKNYTCATCGGGIAFRSAYTRAWRRPLPSCTICADCDHDRHARLKPKPCPPRDIMVRFWYRVSPDDAGCWNWTGGLSCGYGMISKGARAGGNMHTHRFTYELANGPVQPGLHVDHLCRNRRCCNPAHLEAVTPLVNTRRGLEARGFRYDATDCNVAMMRPFEKGRQGRELVALHHIPTVGH